MKLGDRVRKKSGSHWQGRIVGTYSTKLTPEGYAVESDVHIGSVQIYPAAALELIPELNIHKEPGDYESKGYCGSCEFRDEYGFCTNKKIAEDVGQDDREDMLLYEYSEGGWFWVGEKFGCVHHTPK